jgi:phage-related protein
MYTLEYNGTELTGTPVYLSVLGFSKPNMAPMRHAVEDWGNSNGGIASGGNLGTLTIGAACAVTGQDATQLEQRMDALRNLLDPRIDRTLKTSRWPDRYWMVKPTGDLAVEEMAETFCTFTMQFVSAKPWALALVEQSIEFTLDANPKTVVLDSDYVANASDDMDALFIVQNDASSLSSVNIANVTLGETLYVTGAIPTGHYLKADSEKHLLYRSADGTNWTVQSGGKSGRYPETEAAR